MAGLHQQKLNELKPRDWWRVPPEGTPTLSQHIVDKLVAAGISTVEAVKEAGPDKLMQIDGIGKVAMAEIREWLCALDDGKE